MIVEVESSDNCETSFFGRFKPINIEEAWNLESPHQWGETYLSLASDRDLRHAE